MMAIFHILLLFIVLIGRGNAQIPIGLNFNQITNSILSGGRQNEHIIVYPAPIAYPYNPGTSTWAAGVTFPVINITTPNSAFILWGGQSGYGTGTGNTWISTDSARTWSIISGYAAGQNPANPAASSGYQGLNGMCAMGDANGVLYTTGGVNTGSGTPASAPGDRTEIATDAQHWGTISPSPVYTYRAYHQCAVDPKTNYLYIMNGYSTINTNRSSFSDPRLPINDVWSSANNRASSWQQVAPTPPFAPRYTAALQVYASQAFNLSVLTLMGGCTVNLGTDGNYTEAALNDIWISTTAGVSWIQLTPAAPWSARCMFGSATTTAGVLVIAGGRTSGPYQSTSIPTNDDLWTSLG